MMTAHPGNDAGVDILLIDAHGHGPTRADWPDAFLAHGLRLIRIGDETGSGDVSVISGIKVGDRILAKPSAGTRAGS